MQNKRLGGENAYTNRVYMIRRRDCKKFGLQKPWSNVYVAVDHNYAAPPANRAPVQSFNAD